MPLLIVGFLIYSYMKRSRSRVSGSGKREGCQHDFKLVDTKTTTYSTGSNKSTYHTYRCTKCGYEILKDS